jgi:son of sevenless-like protein
MTSANSSTTPIDSQNTPLSGPQKPLINFFKRSLSAEILRDIQQYQSQPYNLAKCKVVHDWMIKQLEVCDKSYDLNKLYELSLQLEPREREEERITRMLHDSVSVSPSGDH